MPESTVEAVVQKALGSAPAEKSVEQPSQKLAPTAQPPAKKDGSASSAEDESSTATELTAFEQELVSELEADEQAEFKELSVREQKTRLDWMKRRYRRETRQRTEDGKIRKAWNALVEAGVQPEDLRALVAKRQLASSPAEKAKTDAAIKRGFERKYDEAQTSEEREAIRDAERTVLETVEDAVERVLSKRVTPLEERLQSADRRQQESRRKSLESEINDLEEKEGFKASLVETYRDDIRRLGVQHPDWSAWKLLHYLATEEELKQGKRANGAAPEKPPVRATPVVKKTPATTPGTASPGRPRLSLEKVIGNVLRRKM